MTTIRDISKKRTLEKYGAVYADFQAGKTVKEIATTRAMTTNGVYTAIRRHLAYLKHLQTFSL